MRPADRGGVVQPVLAGIVTAVVGFGGAFAVVLSGLRAVGATPEQAASGLLVLCVTMGLAAIVLSVRSRMPISIAWSTPGAALLVSAGAVDGGWPAALGAFAVTGALLALAGLWRPLGRWIAAIPAPLASAMLAGVLLTVCLAPARAVVQTPLQIAPVILTWVVLLRLARRWAIPGALVTAAVVIAADGGPVATDRAAPSLAFVTPVLDLQAIVGIALPLFVVTMASQNLTGLTVLRSFGYPVDTRPVLLTTGGLTVAGAPFGAHAINLAAITAALAAGPDAHPDPARRWIAAATAGGAYVVIGAGVGLATALADAAPPMLTEAVAGVALVATLGSALAVAAADPEYRDAAIVTFVVSASAITVAGVSAPFWGLAAGLTLAALRPARRPAAPPDTMQPWPPSRSSP
jgi:benzoate membrane transport protein